MEDTLGQSCKDLMRLVWHTKAAAFKLAEQHNLTPMQLFALHAVFEGTCSMRRVATVMHCDASNITGVIDRLVVMGFVSRTESQTDRREKRLALTTRGEHVIRQIMRLLPEQLGATKLSTAERATLHGVAEKLAL